MTWAAIQALLVLNYGAVMETFYCFLSLVILLQLIQVLPRSFQSVLQTRASSQVGLRGETGRTEEQSQGCSQGWGSDKQSSISSSAASSSRVHMEPGEESGVPAREAGPGRSSRSAVSWACQVPRVSELEKHFQSEAFALLAGSSKLPRSGCACARETLQKALFVPTFQWDILREPQRGAL